MKAFACTSCGHKPRALGVKGLRLHFVAMSGLPAEFEEPPVEFSDEAMEVSKMFQAEASLHGVSCSFRRIRLGCVWEGFLEI